MTEFDERVTGETTTRRRYGRTVVPGEVTDSSLCQTN